MKKNMKRRRILDSIFTNILVNVLAFTWILPIIWIVLMSFSDQVGYISQTFFPTKFTLDNYKELFLETDFLIWIGNTMLIAICNTVLTTLVTLLTAFCLSRFRFKLRKTYINISLILGMFPGFMAMVAVFLILNMFKLINSHWALLVYYVCGAGLGFFISKGYFDTIPTEIDEAALLDNASHAKMFFKIFLPLSKPILIYTALMAFMAPWADYILAGLILTDSEVKTVAVGLYQWMENTKINKYFTMFAAGSVVVAVPIVTLYIALQRYFIEGISSGAVKG